MKSYKKVITWEKKPEWNTIAVSIGMIVLPIIHLFTESLLLYLALIIYGVIGSVYILKEGLGSGRKVRYVEDKCQRKKR